MPEDLKTKKEDKRKSQTNNYPTNEQIELTYFIFIT